MARLNYKELNQDGNIKSQLLVFCDPSTLAYAAVVYLRQ